MKKMKKPLLISTIALLGATVVATASVLTYAGFKRRNVITDPTTGSNLAVAAEGKRLTSYYLDLGIWGTIDNTNYSFWIMVYTGFSGDVPQNVKFIKGEYSGVNLKYNIDRSYYQGIKFFRTSSSNDSTLSTSTNYQHSYYTSTSPGMATDGTGYLEFVTEVTYQVTGWHGTGIDAVGYWR